MEAKGFSIKACAKLWGIQPQVAYNWHSGQGIVPEDRIKQLEAIK